MPHTRSYYLPVLLIIVLTVSYIRLGSPTLFDVDEAVFAEATKEMVESGNWLTPTYNGVNRYDKPILFYWMMALSYKVFGINEFGARFPSATAGALLCVALFFFMRRQTDERRAFYTGISLALSIYFVMYSHAAVTDMTLTLFITMSLLSFYLSLQDGLQSAPGAPDRSRLWLYGFYGFSALAFLTKGLIGILFPFGIAGLYLLLTEGVRGPGKLFSAGGAAFFLLIAAPWYIAEYSANGMEFIDQFFIKHHFRRYTGVISGHEGPWYYYLPALLVGLIPWITFLPGGLAAAWGSLRQNRLGKGVDVHRSPDVLALLWFFFIVLFFSFSTTKLPNYILPSVPAAAILISLGMAGLTGRQTRYAKAVMAAVSLALGLAALVAGKYLVRLGITDTGWLPYVALILFAGTALNLAGAVRKKAYHGAVAFLMLMFLVLVSFRVLPAAGDFLQGRLHKFSLYARENLGSKGELVAYKVNKPSILFYSGRRIIKADQLGELEELMKSDGRIIVITSASGAAELEKTGLTLIEKDASYALLERK